MKNENQKIEKMKKILFRKKLHKIIMSAKSDKKKFLFKKKKP